MNNFDFLNFFVEFNSLNEKCGDFRFGISEILLFAI